MARTRIQAHSLAYTPAHTQQKPVDLTSRLKYFGPSRTMTLETRPASTPVYVVHMSNFLLFVFFAVFKVFRA